MTKHPSRKVMNFRHLLGCDTIGATTNRFQILQVTSSCHQSPLVAINSWAATSHYRHEYFLSGVVTSSYQSPHDVLALMLVAAASRYQLSHLERECCYCCCSQHCKQLTRDPTDLILDTGSLNVPYAQGRSRS